MSDLYTDLENTRFPSQVDNFDKMVDVSLSMLSAVNQYYSKYESGDMAGANEILEGNPALKQALFNAEKFNCLRDAIIGLQRYYMSDVQNYLVNIVQPKGYWNAATRYTKYNVVNYINGGATESYMCIRLDTPVGTLPTDETYFVAVTLRGEKGDSGTGMTPRGEWDYKADYLQYDLVVYENTMYFAKRANSQSTPNKNSNDWAVILELKQEANQIIMPDSSTLEDKMHGVEQLNALDFDSLITKGYVYSASKTENPTVWTETLKKADDTFYATKVSTKGSDGSWTIVTTCGDLDVNATVKYSKENGAWKGVKM